MKTPPKRQPNGISGSGFFFAGDGRGMKATPIQPRD